jgi:hypothetical protein
MLLAAVGVSIFGGSWWFCPILFKKLASGSGINRNIILTIKLPVPNAIQINLNIL